MMPRGSNEDSEKDWVFEAIGTHWKISLPELSEEEAEELMVVVLARIATFDRTYSRFREDSLVSEMARAAGTRHLPDDAKSLLDIYEHLYKVTDGKFTPLIGQTLSDAGYDATYSLTAGALARPPSWQEALEYSFPTLTLKQPALLDFGAAGKGYLVDLIAEYFLAKGVTSFIINAGGDIRYENGSEVLRVGLEHPDDPTQVIGIVSISSGSICGSAGNRRAWGEFTHILDPDTLTSPKHLKAVWVTAPTALVADALATCLFFMRPEQLLERLNGAYEFEYLLLHEDFSCEFSSGFPAEIFSS